MNALVLEEFQAGHFEEGRSYKFFVPTKVNTQWMWSDPSLNRLLERASIKVGELNSFSKLVPNMDLFIHLHVIKEAVISSRIEGTQTNMKEALMPKEELSPEKRDDWQEVQNYTEALNTAIRNLKDLPLSSRMLRQTHKMLMQGARGEHKMPGEFRTSQNWIGGNSLTNAVFIPPTHEYVNGLMGDLENFLHNDKIEVPALIRIGIAHYQFETIHPFLDGNGRLGRLLITLYLVSELVMEKPLLYLSVFFEKNKNEYYDSLTRVRQKNDLLGWLRYFLLGVAETAELAAQTLSDIIALKMELENQIRERMGRRASNGLIILNHLFIDPIIQVKTVMKVCDLSKKAAHDLVNEFVKYEILVPISNNIRNRRFLFQRYLNTFQS
jgi:Fic family protein